VWSPTGIIPGCPYRFTPVFAWYAYGLCDRPNPPTCLSTFPNNILPKLLVYCHADFLTEPYSGCFLAGLINKAVGFQPRFAALSLRLCLDKWGCKPYFQREVGIHRSSWRVIVEHHRQPPATTRTMRQMSTPTKTATATSAYSMISLIRALIVGPGRNSRTRKRVATRRRHFFAESIDSYHEY
jgi:hypothetical protein